MAEATAAARALAEEHSIDLEQVDGSGTDGRITLEDVRRVMAERGAEKVESGASSVGRGVSSVEREALAEKKAPEAVAENRAALSEMVYVRIVQDIPHAVLGGKILLRGETRQVTRLQLQIANAATPGRFEIVGEHDTDSGTDARKPA